MSTTALAISVRWGDRLISSHVLRAHDRRVFSLGSAPGSDVPVPRAGQASFSFGGDGPVVHFTDGVRGQVFRNGDTELPMSDVIHRGLAHEEKEGWTLPLGRRDGVVLEFGNVAVEAWPMKAPLRVGLMNAVWDYRWLNVLMATVMFALLIVLRFELFAMEGADLEDDGVSASAVTLRRVLVTAEKPQKQPRVVEQAPEKLPQQQQVAAIGSPKKNPTPMKRGEGGPRAVGPDLHAIFAGLGGQGVMGNGGLAKELTNALGNVVGNSDGLGGIRLRGNGGGGELGGPLRIGGIGLKVGPPGGGPDFSLKKTEGEGPKVFDPPPEITCAAVGCLDKELIRRVVREHLGQVRYCYEQLLPRMPNLSGRVVVKWHVTGDGIVDSSEVVSSTAQTADLGSCLAGRVRTWRFPAAQQAEAGFAVSYPFVFKLSGQ
jgi:TonB family protein